MAGSARTPRTPTSRIPGTTPIEYRRPGDDDAPYTLASLGADGKPGGEGVDKDIVAP